MRYLRCFLVISVFLMATLTLCPWAKAEAEGEVREVFVPAGDVHYQLAELVRQLQVRAGIDAGQIQEVDYTKAEPGYEYTGNTPWPPGRRVKAFEFRQGTVGEALDAYCKLNPQLNWTVQRGVVLITRAQNGTKPEAMRHAMEKHVEAVAVNTTALSVVLREVKALAESAWVREPDATGTMSADPFAPRCPFEVNVSIRVTNATLRDVLNEVIGGVRHGYWVAYEADLNAGGPQIVFSNWSPDRRDLDLPTLVQCLYADYKPLHGYAGIGVRISDAQHELRRRHHFQPRAAREVLVKKEVLADLVGRGNAANDALLRLAWLFSLNDSEVSLPVIETVLSLRDKDRRRWLALTFPEPCAPGFAEHYLPIWKRLVSDEDPVIRKKAKRVLEWSLRLEALQKNDESDAR